MALNRNLNVPCGPAQLQTLFARDIVTSVYARARHRIRVAIGVTASLVLTNTFLRAQWLLLALLSLSAANAEAPEIPPSSVVRRAVLGYLHPSSNAQAESLESILRNAHVLTHLSPCWLTVADGKGGLEAMVDADIVAFCRQNGISVVPRLAQRNFSKEIAHTFLRNQSGRRQLIAHLGEWLVANGCQGLNLDFEAVPREDRLHLTKFVTELRAAFKPRGLLLTMAVPAKTKDDPKASWSGAFDYAALGRSCDLLVIMAYDEHWGTSAPGPVASLPFVEKVLAYATRTIAREKVLLGMPFYARDWPQQGRGKSWTAKDVLTLVEHTGAQVQWDAVAKSSWFRYVDNGITRTVWFEDLKSIAAKVLAADQSRIAGVSIWRLGNEDPAFWLPIAQYREGQGLKGLWAAFATALRNMPKQ